MKLTDAKRALVTGASRGLGPAIAQRLAEQGLDLVLTARSETSLAAVAADIRQATGRDVRVIPADVADRAALAGLVAQIEAIGGVDVLINNAGMESTLPFDQRPLDEIAGTIEVNLIGPMLLTRALLPGMLRRGRGHIVNISSIGGVMGIAFNEPYSASKFGLNGFTRALRLTAQSSGWPVSASAVCPGFIGGAGLFEDMKRDFGVSDANLDVVPIASVVDAVVQAIEQDLADVFVASGDIRQAASMAIVNPALVEAGTLDAPATAMFRAVARERAAALSEA